MMHIRRRGVIATAMGSGLALALATRAFAAIRVILIAVGTFGAKLCGRSWL
jgi:hypothetical protein